MHEAGFDCKKWANNQTSTANNSDNDDNDDNKNDYNNNDIMMSKSINTHSNNNTCLFM